MDFARLTDSPVQQDAPLPAALCAEGPDALMAATPDVLICLGPDGRVRHASDSLESLCATPAPIAGLMLADSCLPEAVIGAIDGGLRAAVATGVAAITTFTLDGVDGGFGGPRRFEAAVTPMTDVHGKVEQLIVVLRDHTRTQRVIERYEHALAEERRRHAAVERSLLLRERYLALLSHELRSPLHAIQNWTHLLERTISGATPLASRALQGLLNGVREQVDVLDRLLDSPHDAAAHDLPMLMPLNDDRRRRLRDGSESEAA